mmetsp:Transcript_9776/g.28372  ORF Transcript_9776/g.28372 Transcript_9776/m.28372 type:complete len:270 (+) Transcript_9776:937-1746(+)
MPLAKCDSLLLQGFPHCLKQLEGLGAERVHGREQERQHRMLVLADKLAPQLLQMGRSMGEEQVLGQIVRPHHVNLPILVAIHELCVLLLPVECGADEVVGVQRVRPAPGGTDQGIGHLAVCVEGILVRDIYNRRSVERTRPRHHDHHRHQYADRARKVPLDRQQRFPLGRASRHRELEGVAHLELEHREVEVPAHAVRQRRHDEVDGEGHDDVPRAAGDDPAQGEVRPLHVRLRLLICIVVECGLRLDPDPLLVVPPLGPRRAEEGEDR